MMQDAEYLRMPVCVEEKKKFFRNGGAGRYIVESGDKNKLYRSGMVYID
jgi:hypothetical protein